MRVRTNSTYTYRPVMMDRADPPYGVEIGELAEGDVVRVVKLTGCPPPNTMGMCHIADCLTGKFLGLVCTSSLEKE